MSDQVDQVTQLLLDWSDGDEAARERLMPLVFDELRRIARRYLEREEREHTLEPTALVNELYLKLVDRRRVQWKNRVQFFRVAAEMMRQILVDYARARLTKKCGEGVAPLSLNESWAVVEDQDRELVALDDALRTLAEIDPRQAKVVELRFFAGLTNEEIGEVLGISATTVKREWRTARLWLKRDLPVAWSERSLVATTGGTAISSPTTWISLTTVPEEAPTKHERSVSPALLPIGSLAELRDPETGRLDARRIAAYLNVPLKTMAKALGQYYTTVYKTPTAPSLQPDLQPVARSIEILQEVLGDRQSALAWWNSPHPDLGHRSPMDFFLEGHAHSVADMLEGALAGTPS